MAKQAFIFLQSMIIKSKINECGRKQIKRLLKIRDIVV